ncbi:MAG: hypothetical protein ABIZ49_03905, partial [Opitutaceae bacterium]
LRVTSDATGAVKLENTGRDTIPFLFVYEVRPPWAAMPNKVWWHGSLAAGETRVDVTARDASDEPAAGMREAVLPEALQAAGLTRDEAAAMLATWRESYFERPGLRVFWIVPRRFTDEVLPLKISPKPASVERVLVGRTEVLTPAFEGELQREFARDGGKRWQADRYFRAYRERVVRLGGTVGVAPVTSAP